MLGNHVQRMEHWTFPNELIIKQSSYNKQILNFSFIPKFIIEVQIMTFM